MDFSYVLNTGRLLPEKLKALGFTEEKGIFRLIKDIPEYSEFYAEIVLEDKKLAVQVFEKSSGEKYALLDVAKASGSFVGGLRSQVSLIIEEIRKSCILSEDLKDDYDKWLQENYSIKPDFPWDDLTDYAVYRCPDDKWFALIMNIKFKQLGLSGDESVWVVNLKAVPEKIPEIVDRKSVFPAYHMNKKYWITVVLTSVTDFEFLKKLTEESFSLVYKAGKGRKA